VFELVQTRIDLAIMLQRQCWDVCWWSISSYEPSF